MKLAKLILIGSLLWLGCCGLGTASARFGLAQVSRAPGVGACRVAWTMENESELVLGVYLRCPRLQHPLQRHPIDRKF
jgi:hypothetical protein